MGWWSIHLWLDPTWQLDSLQLWPFASYSIRLITYSPHLWNDNSIYIYSHRHNWLWGCNCRGILQSWGTLTWLVVSTPPNNISQLGWLFPIYGRIKNVPNHQPDVIIKLFIKRIPHELGTYAHQGYQAPTEWDGPQNNLTGMRSYVFSLKV